MNLSDPRRRDRHLAIFLLGPTASGKTELAMALKDRLPVELVSADSTMVYRGMDIGSAKPDRATLRWYPHRLIDICDPADPYSAARFARDARREMEDIAATGRIPLLVGGTMLYFRVLVEGLANLPEADVEIRQEIQQQAERHGWPWLHERLAEVDPETASRLHPNHSQRIQRALEVYRISGRTLSELLAGQGDAVTQSEDSRIAPIADRFHPVQLAIAPEDRSLLHERIERRFHCMLELGLQDEVERLLARGDLHSELPSVRSVGYRQMWGYLMGEYNRASMIKRSVAATRQLAKRQLTWLRRWPNLRWIALEDGEGRLQDMSKIVDNALKILKKAPI